MASNDQVQDSRQSDSSRRGGFRGRGRENNGYRGPMRGEGPGNDLDGQSGMAASGGNARGHSRGRGRGRGRGNRDRAISQSQEPANTQPPPQPGGNGVSGSRLTRDAMKDSNGENKGPLEDDDDEAEVCFICASTIDHHSVAPCNHRTCHVCALRLRALYKNKACAHCRTDSPVVIFTDDAEKRFEEYAGSDFYRKDENLGISFEKQEIFEDTVVLLRYNCPDSSCDVACLGWPDLHRHVKSVHHKVMCDLCTRNKKVFTHEHELFTPQDLRKHEKFGDDNPGAVDQSGFKGHPECGFCKQRFYGDDELYVHCRDRHERCHVCDRRTGGNNPRYFVDYPALEQHFGKDHFPCLDQECLEKKFVVFDSEMDLKAHQLESHPNGLSKDARRDARRVDISSFNYRPEYQMEQRSQRGGRRAGRGRDPNAEGSPAVASSHVGRAEAAHQRAREIQSAQSVTSRTFGGQLSQPEPPSQTVRQPTQSAPQPSATAMTSAPAAAEALTPQEQARRLRHAAVTERASTLLRGDQTKLTQFRDRISAYRIGTTSAPDLIDAFFSLFDTSSAELGKLVKELADIFEIPGKRDTLLKAWSDWKAINEDYPSLPGPSGTNSTSAASVLGQGIGASRVLKLKSNTAQSSRSAVSKNQSWGGSSARGGASSSSNGVPFPALPARMKPNAAAPPAPTPSWLAPRQTASAGSSARSSAAPSRVQSSQNLAKVDLFPALPAAKKPTSTVFSPGYRGAGVIRSSNNNSSNSDNAWGGGSASGSTTPQVIDDDNDQGKKKGRKGKQVLFQWG